MAVYVPVNGAWRNIVPYVPVAGAWRQVPQIYVPLNGTWRAIYSYYWEALPWGGCSVACGGGVQYRTVLCRRAQDYVHFGDHVCLAFVGGKPPTSQACNTHPCISCRYDMNGNWPWAFCVHKCWGGQPNCWVFYVNHTIISNGAVCGSNCNLNQGQFCKHGAGCTGRVYGNALAGTTNGSCGPYYVGQYVPSGVFNCDWDGRQYICGPF